MSPILAPAGPPTEEDLALAGPPPLQATARKSGRLGLTLHVLMLVAAAAGIAYTNFEGPHFMVVWLVLAPFYGLVCILDGLRFAHSGSARVRLVVTQVLHWLAFLGAMFLIFVPVVRGVLSEIAASVGLLVMLALGTFVAGVHAWSWRVCAVGIFLAASIPVMPWIDETSLLLLVAGLTIVALIIVSWFAYRWEFNTVRH